MGKEEGKEGREHQISFRLDREQQAVIEEARKVLRKRFTRRVDNKTLVLEGAKAIKKLENEAS